MLPKPWAEMGKLAAVFLLALLALGLGVHKVSIAAAFTDPISGIRAQDESFYSHSAIQMARSGDWLTPKLLGRYFLQKPPLLMALSGLCLQWFGVSLLALRLPVLLAGSLAVVLAFSWVEKARGARAATATAILLVSNPLWHAYSRICQMDALLGAWIVAALYCLAFDSRLASRSAFWGYGIFTAAAIMTKSIGGVLPLLVLLVFSLLVGAGRRPSAKRTLQTFLLTAGLALPWHLYQLLVHPRWFWAEYVQLQILGFGLRPPGQTAQEGQALFYLKRLALTDPFLCVLVLLAVPFLWRAFRKRDSADSVLLVSWLLVAGGALVLFRYKNLQYVSVLIPALSIWVGSALLKKNKAKPAIAVLCALFVLKASWGSQPWGLSYHPAPAPSTAALRAYSEKGRPNELILVSPQDDYYSAVLPLARVRYCFMDSLSHVEGYGPYLVDTGIVVTADQFSDLERWREQFQKRMAAWGLPSTEALATGIVASSESKVLKIIRTHPQSDFFLPTDMLPTVEPFVKSTHQIVPGTPERSFLLALSPGKEGEATRMPRLPHYW